MTKLGLKFILWKKQVFDFIKIFDFIRNYSTNTIMEKNKQESKGVEGGSGVRIWNFEG